MPDVVTCILMNKEGKILLLKRSDRVSTYKEFWAGISGYIEEDEKPIDTAIKEIKEEIGIDEKSVKLINKLDPVEFIDIYDGIKYNWKIFLFLFKFEEKDKIDIDWEHSEYKWILPSKIQKYNTVPCFKEIVSKLFL
jgi:8-oxo-dGTP pyrophosphatase MutT (NUDIX family)